MEHFKFTSNKNSFQLLSKNKKTKSVATEIIDTTPIEELSSNIADFDKRAFLKVLGVAGLGLAATSLFPKKSEALIVGGQSTSGVLGVKNMSDVRINPAKEDGNLATIAGNIPSKGQTSMSSSLPVVIASDQSPIPVTGSFATTITGVSQDTTIQDLYGQLGLLLDRLEYGNVTSNSKTLRVQLNPDLTHNIGTVSTVTGVTTVSTVTTTNTVSNLTNQVRIGDVQAQRVVEAQLDSAFCLGILSNVAF